MTVPGATAPLQGTAWQARGGLSWSPVDFARGFMTLDASDSECAQLAALERARHTIELGAELGELSARRAERDSLVAARAQWQELVTHTQSRVSEGLASEPQLTSVRAEVERLERRIDTLEAEITRLIGAGHEDEGDAATLREDLDAYERGALQLERQQSSIRRLTPWNVTVLGSVVPVDQGMGTFVDWFGWVTVSYNLGGIAQAFAEDETLAAREAQFGADANDLRHSFERFERMLRESLQALRADLAHVDRQIEIQQHQRELLGQLETSEVENVRVMIDLQVIALQSERAHLARLIEVRASLAGPGTDDVH